MPEIISVESASQDSNGNAADVASTKGGKGKSKKIQRQAKDTDFVYLCEWLDCDHKSHSMNEFNHHVSRHRRGYTLHLGPEAERGETQFIFYCQWRDCQAQIEGTVEDFSRHVHYHCFHQYLKCLGQQVQRVENLNGHCCVDQTSRNLIPELPERLQCRWSDCDMVYDNPYIFYSHVAHHCVDRPKDPKQPLECMWEGCKVLVKTWYKMREHMRSHTQAKVVACPTCGSLFANNTRFVDHLMRQAQTGPSFVCSSCSAKFSSERLLRDHMRRHVNHYKCPLCDMTCTSPSAVRDHVRYRHSDLRSFHCPSCQYSAKSAADLKKHVNTHNKKPKKKKGLELLREQGDIDGEEIEEELDGNSGSTTYNGTESMGAAETLAGGSSVLTLESADDGSLQMEKENQGSVAADGANHGEEGEGREEMEVNVQEKKACYQCHQCFKVYTLGTMLSRHLMEVHLYKLPSGHPRFRYKLHHDGMKRLHTIRYESIEVSQQVLGNSLPVSAVAPAATTSQQENLPTGADGNYETIGPEEAVRIEGTTTSKLIEAPGEDENSARGKKRKNDPGKNVTQPSKGAESEVGFKDLEEKEENDRGGVKKKKSSGRQAKWVKPKRGKEAEGDGHKNDVDVDKNSSFEMSAEPGDGHLQTGSSSRWGGAVEDLLAAAAVVDAAESQSQPQDGGEKLQNSMSCSEYESPTKSAKSRANDDCAAVDSKPRSSRRRSGRKKVQQPLSMPSLEDYITSGTGDCGVEGEDAPDASRDSSVLYSQIKTTAYSQNLTRLLRPRHDVEISPNTNDCRQELNHTSTTKAIRTKSKRLAGISPSGESETEHNVPQGSCDILHGAEVPEVEPGMQGSAVYSVQSQHSVDMELEEVGGDTTPQYGTDTGLSEYTVDSPGSCTSVYTINPAYLQQQQRQRGLLSSQLSQHSGHSPGMLSANTPTRELAQAEDDPSDPLEDPADAAVAAAAPGEDEFSPGGFAEVIVGTKLAPSSYIVSSVSHQPQPGSSHADVGDMDTQAPGLAHVMPWSSWNTPASSGAPPQTDTSSTVRFLHKSTASPIKVTNTSDASMSQAAYADNIPQPSERSESHLPLQTLTNLAQPSDQQFSVCVVSNPVTLSGITSTPAIVATRPEVGTPTKRATEQRPGDERLNNTPEKSLLTFGWFKDTDSSSPVKQEQDQNPQQSSTIATHSDGACVTSHTSDVKYFDIHDNTVSICTNVQANVPTEVESGTVAANAHGSLGVDVANHVDMPQAIDSVLIEESQAYILNTSAPCGGAIDVPAVSVANNGLLGNDLCHIVQAADGGYQIVSLAGSDLSTLVSGDQGVCQTETGEWLQQQQHVSTESSHTVVATIDTSGFAAVGLAHYPVGSSMEHEEPVHAITDVPAAGAIVVQSDPSYLLDARPEERVPALQAAGHQTNTGTEGVIGTGELKAGVSHDDNLTNVAISSSSTSSRGRKRKRKSCREDVAAEKSVEESGSQSGAAADVSSLYNLEMLGEVALSTGREQQQTKPQAEGINRSSLAATTAGRETRSGQKRQTKKPARYLT